MQPLDVTRGDGYELHQLGDLNNLRKLVIMGLGLVNSKEEALQAKLADKRLVTYLSLSWLGSSRSSLGLPKSSPEVQADVLEGLCPPDGLDHMRICNYEGSRYPGWMFGPEKSKMYLQTHELVQVHKLIPAPVPELFFVGVTALRLHSCNWDAMPYNMVHLTLLEFFFAKCDTLPDNMDQLTSLRRLIIDRCLYFRLIPALPTSLQYLKIHFCHEEFTISCKDKNHPNYKAIENIPKKSIISRPSPEELAEEDRALEEKIEYYTSVVHADHIRRS